MRAIPKKILRGMTPSEQLGALHREQTHELVDLQYSTYNRSLLPLLENKRSAMIIREHEQLTSGGRLRMWISIFRKMCIRC